MTTNTFLESGNSLPTGVTDLHVEAFVQHLQAVGYTKRTLLIKRSITASFARWARDCQIAPHQLNDSHLSTFVQRPPRHSTWRIRFELATLKKFLEHLRAEAGLPIPAAKVDWSPAEELRCRYVDYLRSERGLAQNSICVYSHYIRDFLAALMTDSGSGSPQIQALDAATVHRYLVDRIRDRSSEYSSLLAIALRSFLRFLFLHSETSIDLSVSVPMVRKWAQASIPAFLSADEVDRVVSCTDRSTPGGRRDHAIMLLMARLGLRAGEVVSLELDDIHWRTGEIVVRGKGQLIDRLPLLSDVGESLSLYLRESRGQSESKRVFLRSWAPRVGLTGHAAVTHIVRTALARAGVHTQKHVAAHVFRHSLATMMIRNGASMAEISELLRHRSVKSTTIYAKVDFGALRAVARPWPATGGGR